MIEKIIIKDTATYDNKGIEITELGKINFIYGTNGSGKTTISRYFDNSEKDEFKNCSLKWENDVVLKSYVYNKEFCDKNFGKSNIEGIFTLGSATKEQIEEINQKKDELKEVNKNIIANSKTIENLQAQVEELENGYKNIIWDVYKNNENDFKEALKGYLTKDKFFVHMLEIYSRGVSTSVSRDNIKKRAKTLLGEQPEKKAIIKQISFNVIEGIVNDAEWNKSIAGKNDVNISKLIETLKNADWVNQGRKYIVGTTKCPFCQKDTIDDEFKMQLEMFFDKEYESRIKHIEELYTEFLKEKENILKDMSSLIELREEAIDSSKLESLHKALVNAIELSENLMREKIKEPGKVVVVHSFANIIDEINQCVLQANKEIQTYNSLVENYKEEKRQLIEDIWKMLVIENKVVLDTYISKKAGQIKGIDNVSKSKIAYEQKKGELINEIKEKNKNVTSVQPAVDEMNRTLRNYGFTNFRIVPSVTEKNHYQIQRMDGKLVESTLSEGEVTFITFLYFLQLIKGSKDEENVSEERIIIVDDPISSLDSTVLFVVSSLLKDILFKIMKDESTIRQAIILTHNVYFHKEISFIGDGNSPRKDIRYWILRKKDNISNIQYYGMDNPISSSYQLLWKELKAIDVNSSVTIQNIMRRIIENYFKILGGYKDETLIEKFPDFENKEICRSLLSWINDGSHCLPDDLFVEMPDETIEKYQIVFKRIFEYTNHLEHYNMMMGIEES